MNNRDFKIKLIELLKERDIFTEQPSPIEIRTRCPYCGDSTKNRRTGHFYIRINPNDNLPIVYNCFKCPAGGIIDYETLDLLGVGGTDIKSNIIYLNNTSDKLSSASSYEAEDKFFEYKLPNPREVNGFKIDYIERRLGLFFTDEQLSEMKVITSLKEFMKLNNIKELTCKKNIAQMLERQFIGFISNNNSHILFRNLDNSGEIRWYKHAITEEARGQKIFYSMSSSVDLYSDEDITINLSEGVMDAISIAYNLNNESGNNVLNVAVCGKFYKNMVRRLLTMGFIGGNIIFNIYADNDGKDDTSIEFLRKELKQFVPLVKEINVYYNQLSKDCGVPKNQILLQHYKI